MIKSAAAAIPAELLLYYSAMKDQHWSQTIETVTAEHGSLPDAAKLFLNALLCSQKNIDKSDALSHLVELFCADFVHSALLA